MHQYYRDRGRPTIAGHTETAIVTLPKYYHIYRLVVQGKGYIGSVSQV